MFIIRTTEAYFNIFLFLVFNEYMNPCCFILEMNAAAASVAAPGGSKAAPPKFKQKEARQFKSKAPKAGQKG